MTGQTPPLPANHHGGPACWSWPAMRPTKDDVRQRFFDGLDTTGYSTLALQLLRDAADALSSTDEEVLTAWQARPLRRLRPDRPPPGVRPRPRHRPRTRLCSSCNTRKGTAVGPGTVFPAYRERPPTVILGLTIRYRDPLTRRHVVPEPPRADNWDDNASAGLT
ncbi:hypothetical protein [Streptomyces violascens]